jgi:hypothetical protein
VRELPHHDVPAAVKRGARVRAIVNLPYTVGQLVDYVPGDAEDDHPKRVTLEADRGNGVERWEVELPNFALYEVEDADGG